MEVSDLVNCSETSTGILAGGIDVKNIGFNGAREIEELCRALEAQRRAHFPSNDAEKK